MRLRGRGPKQDAPAHARSSRAALGLAALGLALVLACTAKPTDTGDYPPAPDFAAKTLGGEAQSLEDLKGKVVLINVWATWCEPCVAELPELAELHRSLEGRGFTVIGLNADVATQRLAVKRMVEANALPYPIWLDPKSKAQVAFELNGYPTSILIDRQGRIRWRREGVIVRGDRELMPLLEQVLAESPS